MQFLASPIVALLPGQWQSSVWNTHRFAKYGTTSSKSDCICLVFVSTRAKFMYANGHARIKRSKVFVIMKNKNNVTISGKISDI